ncbi:MAG TPA: nitroreductase family protein [Bacteroidales bacterium]|jgi:nitroreductase|nr:nitroreductase family protein [Bacteroidales bacterium]
MEFTELINRRESIRDYDPQKPVPKHILEKILDAGRLAPSACNIQPWEFLIIQSPEMLEKVKACYHRQWFKDAPIILVIVGFADKAWTRSFDKYNSIETDLAITMTHIILAAENEGVGTCYIEAYDPAILKDALKLKDDQKVFGITPLGYPRSGFVRKNNKNRKLLSEVVRYL